jgi:hypothetical protein
MLFQVTINLGNEAMQTSGDVADALELIARDLRWTFSGEEFGMADVGTSTPIRDANGNTVGTWHVEN